MTRRMSAMACSIALFTFVVNERAHSGQPPLSELYSQVRAGGESMLFPENLGAHLDLKKQADFKIDEIDESEAADKRTHSVLAFQAGEEKGLIFVAGNLSGSQTESFYCQTDLHGNPLRAFIHQGKNDKSGAPVRGSAKFTDMQASSRVVSKKIKAELDFWLKGKGRKKAKAPAKP